MSYTEDRFSMTVVTFVDLKKVLEGLLDTGAAVILYEAGLGCGRRMYMRMRKQYSSREEILKAFIDLKLSENWGEIKVDVNLDSGEGKIVVYKSFEGKYYGASSTPICHFFKGYIEGFLRELIGREITVEETKCVAMGDENCTFEIR